MVAFFNSLILFTLYLLNKLCCTNVVVIGIIILLVTIMCRLKSNPDSDVSKFCGKNIECVKKNPAGRFQQKNGFTLTSVSKLTAYHIDLHSVLLWFVVLF